MSVWRRSAAVALAVGLTLGTAALSRMPVRFAHKGDAMLRLSWKINGVTVEACRERSPEELAALPVHMRNPEACIGGIAPYVLEVTLDGATLPSDTVRARGARGDRPLFVLQDLPVRPGRHDVSVRFRALIPDGVEAPADGILELAWSGPLELAERDVALITLDGSARALQVRLP
ncbi:MAG TPA: hypothetical protein VLA36_09300 [Longimicrobiales bacterium]|nr:hypothetical protein [Longimicrobiales bacterium]